MKKLKKLVVVVLITIITSLLTGCMAVVPVPTTREARFDFSLTYEINGEEQTYNGVYVCKFEGIYISFFGNGRDWSSYIEGEENYDEIAISTNDDGIIYIGLYFKPEYFMSDPDWSDYYPPEPTMYIIYHSDDPEVFMIDNEDDIDFMEKYGVRLISYSYPEPLNITYEERFGFGRLDFNIN